MSDVFISYRHGQTDSWIAGRIRDRLQKHFALFFDTSREVNDYGDDFEEEVDEALATCRVLFAIIGPDWVSPESLRRLSQPQDWVAYELRMALSNPDVRIIPLFIAASAPPEFKALSGEWQPLTTRVGRSLNPDLFDADLDDLTRRLRNDWLSARTTPVREKRLDMPPALPYLCNRTDQEEDFAALLPKDDDPVTPIACVVHGYRDAAHDELRDRFEASGDIARVLSAAEGVVTKPMQVSRERLRDGRFADTLKSGLKAAVLNDRTASDETLGAFLADCAQPLVVSLQLTWSDYQDIGDRLVRGLIEAWHDLPRCDQRETDEQRRGFVPLLWINFTYDEVETRLSTDVLVRPLAKLPPIVEGHVRSWVNREDVKPHVEDRKDELIDIPRNPKYYFTPGQVHMRRFAEAVREIMSSPKPQTPAQGSV